MKKIIVDEIYSEEDLGTMKGEYFGDEWIHQMIDEDCDIYDSNNEFILSFRKRDLKETKVGFDNFKKLIVSSRGRGGAAGPIDPESTYWKKRKLVNTKGHSTGYLKKDGTVSKMKVNNNVYSTPIGYFDKLKGGLGKEMPCRLTHFTKGNLDVLDKGLPFIKEIAKRYQEIRPTEFNYQNDRAAKTKDYILDDTPFSTITVNRNFRTALHKDAGDFGGIACLSVLEEGMWNGGLFLLPRYGLGVNMRQGDLLICNVHEYHANTECWTTPEQDIYNDLHAHSFRKVNKAVGILGVEHDYSRLSFVCYLREKMIECDL
tara:strand:- start:654 stop:1601 length:948 start_codon:yes stop_codon:yes gene_type:complete